MRVQNSTTEQSSLLTFSKYLLDIGDGRENIIKLDANMVHKGEDFNGFCENIYPNFASMCNNSEYLVERTIVTPKHSGVKYINDHMLKIFPADERVYLSPDSVPNMEDQSNYPVEFINSIDIGNLPPHQLRLKSECPVMLLRNLDISKGLCNGTRLICKQFFDHVILTEIATGPHKGDLAMIPRITLSKRVIISSSFQQKTISLNFSIWDDHRQITRTIVKTYRYLPS